MAETCTPSVPLESRLLTRKADKRSACQTEWQEKIFAMEESLNTKISSFFKEHQDLHRGWLMSLHSLAETSFEEEETSNFVYSVLKEHCPSLKVTRGLTDLPTAVVAVFTPRDETQRTLLLRADMDALPVCNTNAKVSKLHPNVHHACGHDGHMTCLLATAHWLQHHPDVPQRKLVLFFQPAEEWGSIEKGGSGARVAIKNAGLLDTLHGDVSAVYALHSWPGLEVGEFAVGPSTMMGMSAPFTIQMNGSGGHAAKHSQTGGDALLAACTLVLSAQTVVSRGTDPFDPAVATFTRVESVGNSALNSVQSRVRVHGTVRTLDAGVRQSIREQIRRHAEGAAAMHGCTAVLNFRDAYPATKNSHAAAAAARAAALRAAGGFEGNVREVGLGEDMERPSLCAEDFSYLLEKRGGAYVWLGVGKNAPQLHQSNFVFDERAIPFGGKLFVYLAVGRESDGDRRTEGEF